MSETEKITPEKNNTESPGSYQVVARRYRPKTFDELVGQEHISQALSNAISGGRVGHAYLFTGARGTGKTTTARIFAKGLNCVSGPTINPCGECDSCRSVSVGEDIDAIEIDGASNNGVDEIRKLRESATVCPSRSRFKIYIIDEVHMLSKAAFNALLKILEEPPKHVKFIFCTTDPQEVPVTILSRCQRFDFAGIDTGKIAERLAEIAANENITAEDGVFTTLARRANGSMRDAQSLLEQLLSFAPEHLKISDVHEMLGSANDQLLFALLQAMLADDVSAVFSQLDKASSEGTDFGILTEQLLGAFRDLLVLAAGGSPSLMLYCSSSQPEETKKLADDFGMHRILAAMQILDQSYYKMRYSTQSRILLELALIRIAHLGDFQQITSLIDQLRKGKLTLETPAVQRSVPLTVQPVQRTIPPPKPVSENTVKENAVETTPARTAERLAMQRGPIPAKPVPLTSQERSALYREAADNPFVKEIEKVFETELTDVSLAGGSTNRR
ncbi:MAG: DNA polymerase III subunit gamma/tau [Planctomycetaceae bacterium]|nr:DNA polymerase III subunit gamma/tau [Planctomycetaceae bacterium]